MRKIVIGGIGSVLLGDDGIGPYVATLLETHYRFDSSVTVVDLGTPGLDLVAHLSGIDAMILIDSVANGAEPGSVTLYRREDILRNGPAPVRMDPHSPALSESILIADLTGQGPQDVLLVGITGEQYEACSSLSESVRKAVAPAVNAVLEELDRLDVSYSKPDAIADLVSWWEPLADLAEISAQISLRTCSSTAGPKPRLPLAAKRLPDVSREPHARRPTNPGSGRPAIRCARDKAHTRAVESLLRAGPSAASR